MQLSAEQIAACIQCPVANVKSDWPTLEQCLSAFPEYSDKVGIAALATVAVETANTFKPIHEFGSKAYFLKHYDGRKDLGNTHAGDGYTYRGRGYVQITGEVNYESYAKMLGIDLTDDPNDPNDDNDPEKACDPMVAACILTAYFHDRKVYQAANMGDWLKVRKLVNGGTNGLDKFQGYVAKLLKATGGA